MSATATPRQYRAGEPFFRRCPISSVKAVDREANTVDAMVSTVNPDRYREIVVPSAFMRRLDSFLRNPVHLWAHNPSQLENVIGKALDVKPVKSGFLARFQYAVEENPKARMALALIEAGYLNAYSVGFFVHEWITPKELDKYPEIRAELVGVDLAEVEVIFIDVELFEISLCAVPANRESLVVGRGTLVEGTPDQIGAFLSSLADAIRRREEAEKEVTTVGQAAAEQPAENDKAAPQASNKMNVALYDCASRLRSLADVLCVSKWYDDDKADIAETRDGAVKVLDDVRATILDLFGDEPESTEKTARVGPRTKEGRAISGDNAKCIRSAYDACMQTAGHLETLLDQLPDEDDGDEDEDPDVELEDDAELEDMDEDE